MERRGEGEVAVVPANCLSQYYVIVGSNGC